MNPQNGQTPLDYLNQIAPQTPKKQRFQLNMRTVIFGGVIAVVLVIILALTVSGLAGRGKEPWQTLSARLTTTQTIANDATTNLKNSQIRSANSDLKIYLTNTQRDLAAPLQRADIDPKKLPASVSMQESATAMIERLEDGRLNAKFDSTYAREMSYHLSTILALHQQLYAASKNPSTREFLSNSFSSLEKIQEDFANFSASNE